MDGLAVSGKVVRMASFTIVMLIYDMKSSLSTGYGWHGLAGRTAPAQNHVGAWSVLKILGVNDDPLGVRGPS